MMETHKRKRWTESSRQSQEYLNGVEQFLNFAFEKKCTDGKISCPCQRCVLHNCLNRAEAYDYLVVNGIMPSYDKIFGYQDPIMVSIPENSFPVEHETHKGDSMVQMLQDVFGLIGEHVDMDIDRRRHIEGNEEGSSTQCVEGYSLEEKGEDFANYADFCFKMFGDRVKNWMTMNEPKVIASCGYDSGIQALGRCSKEYGNCAARNLGIEPYIVGHNLLLSHAAAVQRYRQKYQDAFILWDTYGFLLDLTQLMAEERSLAVDVKGFNAAMDKARERSRSAQTKDHESTINAIYCGTEFLESAEAGKKMGVVLESTSFYDEQGGQIFDTGSLQGHLENLKFAMSKYMEALSFILVPLQERLVDCQLVDYHRRSLIAPNHTCTHMLNFALREVLGDHVDQKGSIVLPEKLRFDFSHGKPVQNEELRKIETIVNDQIKAELDVYAKEVTLSDAKRINGLKAEFGEIYLDPVRVVSIGKKVDNLLADPDNAKWLSYSAQLCGGTHLSNTKEAKAFALISEEGIAKGVRRVTAITTDCAFEALELAHSLDQEAIDAAKIEGSMLEKKVASLQNHVDAAPIPAAKKNDIRAKISLLQKAVKAACEKAEAVVSDGKGFCIACVDVGLDATAVREAVLKVIQQKVPHHFGFPSSVIHFAFNSNILIAMWMDEQGISAMIFNVDESTNKVVVYAGVPNKGNTSQVDNSANTFIWE
ncbi:hypothetical protein Ancab_001052 [Ancistrocladus abbreviatus]